MDKHESRNLKGIAILVMLLHHLFPLAWTSMSETAVYPVLESIFDACKICVAMYAFLCGYGYYHAKEKTLQYSLSRCWILLKHYWLQLFLIFIPVACLSGYTLTPGLLIRNLFGFTPNLNFFAWYVYFHIFAMLVLPLCIKLFRFNFIVNVIIAVLCGYLPEVLFHSLPGYGSNVIISNVFNCFLYLPCVLVGFLCAKHNVYEILTSKLPKNKLLYAFIVLVIIGCRILCANILGFAMDTVYVPIFIYCWLRILQGHPNKILSLLGKYSTQIWFFHAVFFSTYIKDYCQALLLFPKNPLLILLWCIVLCLAAAIVLEKIALGLDSLFKRIKKVKERV